ncbi:uncharacterized protein LOC127839360 isoform X2 [Dreissena polymorpha]|uniref:uncharacterized protein LOC127839360 isoform X2 n=1 Tax=Dreissena polymorpha TaxID=45954 RepID=UPI002263EABD|nr:uncharacterized protein LOC127839360 isoform X2 [Dreissena polymorpha]
MGQCCSKQEKYRQKGNPEKEHRAENGKAKAAPQKGDENKRAEPPENMTNKADKDTNSRLVEQVDKKNPAVVKKDVSAKPDNGLGIKHPTSTPPSNRPLTGTKKHSRKKKSAAKSGNSSSSGWTDSSESSESSDSSYGKENKGVKQKGNTIVYSKSKSKTTVKGNSYKVDNRKGVLNITEIGHQTVVVKLFSGTGYSLEEACDFEKRQLNEIPAGCLVNLRGKQLVQEYVFNTQVRSDASAWVGIIMLGDVAGTCFRVGDKKIMTALHVIKLMLEKSYIPLHSGNQNLPVSAIFVKSGQQETQGQVDEPSQVAALSKLKDAYVDFSFVKDDQYRYKEHSVFNLKPLHSLKDVPFFDNGTDCIVLEILPNTKGTPMPLPFSLFSPPKLEEGFHIIGHPGGSKKTFDHVDRFIDPGKEKTKKDIHTIKSESKKFLAKHGKDEHDYQFDVAHTIYSKDRFLFHCTSSQGASGAPGVVVDEDGRVFVVTMLLHGYPDWYYDPKSNGFKTEWPKQYCVEQGASMKAIFIQMQKEKPDLCKEIFDQRGN